MIRLIEALTMESDRFDIELWPGGTRRIDLPDGYAPIRRWRKRFLVLLVLCRLWNRPFHYAEESVRKLFPEFKPNLAGPELVGRFVGAIRGRMREGFEPLFGPSRRKQRRFVQIYSVPGEKNYVLRLDRAALVFRLRV